MITNRRKFHRIPVDEQCIAVIDGVELPCKLIEQSISGAKITGLEFLLVPYAKELSVKQGEEAFDAVIRSVTRTSEGKIHIGIERKSAIDPKAEEVPGQAMLLNCFIRHEGNLMICIPLSVQPDKRIKIQLWDGQQLTINQAALSPMSRSERYKTLMSGSNLAVIAKQYGIQNVPLTRLLDKIFEFEFGTLASCEAKAQFANA